MWPAILTTEEAEFTKRAIAGLGGVDWARPILARLDDSGGISKANKPLMFEVRFAYALHCADEVAEYEYSAGLGNSTIDFCIPGNITWLVELVSIETSQAVKNATTQNGPFFTQFLQTNAPDKRQSPEGEMLLVQQKIGEKAFSNNSPVKFPEPTANIYQGIIADVRGFRNAHSDKLDYLQIAYGPNGLPKEDDWAVHWWGNEPIKGLFEKSCPLKAASTIKERIHFLGFVSEQDYTDGEILKILSLYPNRNLVSHDEAEYIITRFRKTAG